MKWLKRIGLFLLSLILLIMISVFLFWMPSTQEPAYELTQTWGEKGDKIAQFNEPTGIATEGNEVFISDSRNARIQVFDLSGNFLRQFGTEGDEKLRRPMNLTIANNELYVADYFNDKINIYTLSGAFLRSIGSSGNKGGEFNSPGGVAVAKDGSLYVADFFNQRIQQLDKKGQFIRQWGQTKQVGMTDGKMNYPTDVAIDELGQLYIADGYNDRILALNKQGEITHKWGGPFTANIFGPFNGWFATVTGVNIGPKGHVFVADFYNDRVQKFTPSGQFLTAFGIKSNTPTHTAIAVTIAHDGSVFVADYANHQVQKWQQK